MRGVNENGRGRGLSVVGPLSLEKDVEGVRRGLGLTLAPVYDEGTIVIDNLIAAAALLRRPSLEAHKEALRILEDDGLLSFQRWEGVHNSNTHNLSNPRRQHVNGLIKRLLREHPPESGVSFCEMGTGMGVDLVYASQYLDGQVVGIDSSDSAVRRCVDRFKMVHQVGKMPNRVQLMVGNYMNWMKERDEEGQRLDMIYGYSSLHYQSPMVLRDETFPLLARVLSPGDRFSKPGILAFSMKTARSASAKSNRQLRLTEGKYKPSIDMEDMMFRIYPRDMRAVLDLVEPSFEVLGSHLARRSGYDVTGETEYFAELILTPRLNNGKSR